MTSRSSASEAPSERVVFGVQRSARLLLPLLIGLSVGCVGSRDVPKYAWLRKQGPVQTMERSPAAPVQVTANNAPSIQSEGEQDLDQLSVSNSTGATQTELRNSLNLPSTAIGVDAPISLSYSAKETLHHSTLQDTAYYAPEPRRWNVKALSSLPIALTTVIVGIASQSIYLLLIGGAISFTLGLIGSRQCRDREDRGKGFAIAGMALGAAALFFSLMVLFLAA